MNTIKLLILNREFDLEVTFDCYTGEEILDTQKEALNDFKDGKPELDKAFEAIKAYCLKNRNKIDLSINNIFDYVMPRYVFVKRNNKHEIALMCDYKFDQEHGIAILFENNSFVKVISQDELL